MIITNSIFFATLFLTLTPIIIALLLLTVRFYKIEQKWEHKFDKLSTKIVNLYLDKKFVCKLLKSVQTLYTETHLLQLLNEILDYFCLDLLALYITIQNKILMCKSTSMDKLYTQNDIKLLINNAKVVSNEIGYYVIKNEDRRQFIVFKHPSISVLALSEINHSLSKEEKKTFIDEIMLLLTVGVRFIKF